MTLIRCTGFHSDSHGHVSKSYLLCIVLPLKLLALVALSFQCTLSNQPNIRNSVNFVCTVNNNNNEY